MWSLRVRTWAKLNRRRSPGSDYLHLVAGTLHFAVGAPELLTEAGEQHLQSPEKQYIDERAGHLRFRDSADPMPSGRWRRAPRTLVRQLLFNEGLGMAGEGIDWHGAAFIAAGVVTMATAAIHGRLLDPMVATPLLRQGGEGMRAGARRLVRPLLHVSTADWMLCGIALVASGIWIDGSGRVAVGVLVCAQLFYATICNAWATRGRHPGWMLMASAIALTAFGLGK